MQAEIMARGPIACGFVADDAFAYNLTNKMYDGVYVDRSAFTDVDIDHSVSVTGWGISRTGIKYWIVRNTWGSYWGEAGWFYTLRGENALAIESRCYFATPDFSDLDDVLDHHKTGNFLTGLQQSPQTQQPLFCNSESTLPTQQLGTRQQQSYPALLLVCFLVASISIIQARGSVTLL